MKGMIDAPLLLWYFFARPKSRFKIPIRPFTFERLEGDACNHEIAMALFE